MTQEKPEARCLTCGANWSQGEWTKGCEECGGGALEIRCIICGGRCGSTWRKSVMDTNDFGMNHWHGDCRLSEWEQRKIRLETERKNRESGYDEEALFKRMMRNLDERLAHLREPVRSEDDGD